MGYRSYGQFWLDKMAPYIWYAVYKMFGTTQGLMVVSHTSVQKLLHKNEVWSGVWISFSPTTLLKLSFFAKYHEAARE